MLEKRIKNNADALSRTLNAVKLLNEDELSHLYELHDLYVKALDLTGELMSDALYLKDTAYTERKHEQARLMIESEGTIAERQAHAEIAVKEYRDNEDKGNYIYTRYKARNKSLDHKLFDIKAKRAAMEKELQNT
ncbi:MAG TPA: hypothetical protein VK093_00135 [Candidatus Avipropionibacterium sp.]|nr:hypothetical protein [Candidatus Avipropionibacterium sp.]